MEPRREEQPQAPPPSAEPKPKRFRVVKLEERIAPSKYGTNKQCPTNYYHTCWCVSNFFCGS